MACQVCPKCRVKHITWSIDEDASPWTKWYCGNCGYFAEEDESRESDCPHCASTRSWLLVKDIDGFHRWCCICGAFENTTESFIA